MTNLAAEDTRLKLVAIVEGVRQQGAALADKLPALDSLAGEYNVLTGGETERQRINIGKLGSFKTRLSELATEIGLACDKTTL